MKICKEHWSAMRKKVQDAGLWHLVSSSSEEAAEKIGRAIEEGNVSGFEPVETVDGQAFKRKVKVSKENWDPLLMMNFNFMERGLVNTGIAGMSVYPDDEALKYNDGHVCPLCEAKKVFDLHNTESGRCGDPRCVTELDPDSSKRIPWDVGMIESCGDAMLAYAVKEGLVKTQ